MTLADLIGVLRALATVPIALAIAADARAVALAIFAIAAATDALDGWVARRMRTTTGHGAVLDPMADKVLVVGTLIALAAVGTGWPVTIVAVLVTLREGVVAILRARAVARGAALPADSAAKAKTALEMAGLALVIVGGRPWAVLGTGIVGLALVIGVVTIPHYLPRSMRRLT